MSTRSSRSFFNDGSSSLSMSSVSSDVGMSLKLNDLPIYGRDSEVETLNNVFNEEKSQSTLVTVHGKAGSGKSALIESLRETWALQKNCLFASGRFDPNSSDPFSGFINVLRDLIDQWSSTDEGIKEIQSFAPKMDLDEKLLHRVVPRFSEIYGMDKTNNQKNKCTKTNTTINDIEANYGDARCGCIQRVMQELLLFLCRLKCRIVLFLDNVEWADRHSREYLDKALQKPAGLDGLLLIVSYVDEELSKDHPIQKVLTQSEQSKTNWNFHTIHVQDLELNAVNQIVSSVTKTEPEKSLPLSEIVLKKAGGNSFYILQFLRLLEEENFLTYSFNSLKWEWGDVATIDRSMNVSDDVADIVATSMKRLKAETLQVLMIASCFGSEIPLNVLTDYLGDQYKCPTRNEYNQHEEHKEEPNDDVLLDLTLDSKQLKRILNSCVKAGILGQRQPSEPYTWLHDKLQHAAYSMIAVKTRSQIHFNLGYVLDAMNSSFEGEGWMVYMAADQFNKAFALKSEAVHSGKVADLNLRAAKLSTSKSAFYPAIDMLRSSLKYLDEKTRWKENYNLTLEIYSNLAETDFTVGNHDDVTTDVNEVLTNAQRKEDKFRAQYVQIKSVASGASRDYARSVQLALDILDEYNVRLPRKPNKLDLFVANRRVRSFLKDGRIENLLELPGAVDEIPIIVGKLLVLVGKNSLYLPDGSNLAWLSSLHALRLASDYGVSDGTVRTLIHLGASLQKQLKMQEACDHVHVAVKLCYKFNTIAEETRFCVKMCAFGTILPGLRPFHECLDELLSASQIGLRAGETQLGTIAGFVYCLTYFCVGLPLGPMKSDLISFGNDARQFGLPPPVQAMFQMLRQTILNLEGESDYPTVLKGDAIDQDEILSRMKGMGHTMTLRDINTYRLILSLIFRDLDTTEAMMEVLVELPDSDQMFCRSFIRTAFMALGAIMLGRKRGIKKYQSKGKKMLKQIRSQVKKGSTNSHPILLMLEAEHDPSKARYDAAIAACARSGLIHYQAYMCESTGLYFLDLNDEGWAEYYLPRALELYQDWGANEKVNMMKTEHEFLRQSGQSRKSYSSLKGRSRHQGIVKGALGSFRRLSIVR